MTVLYRVAGGNVHHSDPLHVGNFYPNKLRHHRAVMQRRQDLILYLANLHAAAVDTGMPLGMIHIPMRLMSLRDWVQDYHVVLDAFFEIEQLGYNLGDGDFELSILVPKNVTNGKRAASKAAREMKYVVPERPDTGAVSKVYIQQQNAEAILKRLASTSRLDLKAPVQWLLEQVEVNFHFERSGKLQQRDTSIWPVKGVETWPAWLREMLFGEGVDIDSAYTQFLVENLRKAYIGRESLLDLMYPDLLLMLEDKKTWRNKLCTETLKIDPTDENIGVVKKLCMSLANGSRISPAILLGNRSFSVTADIILASTDDVSPMHLIAVGKRLRDVANQFVTARKMLCMNMLNTRATRANQKKVFSSYFEWEREARYAIWEACDRHGVMVHDGIDGIPEQYLNRMPQIMDDLNIRLTRG
jgi:hypothetical protein